MSRGMRMSILGLYNYKDNLFSGMMFPTGFNSDDKETVISNILAECAELECLFPDWYTMFDMIRVWSKLELFTWQRIYNAALKEYNPIENYNRTEIETISDDKTETHSGNDVSTLSGTDSGSRSQTNSGTDSTTNKIAGYDSTTLQTHDTSDLLHGHAISESNSLTHGHIVSDSGSDSMSYGKRDTFTHGEKIEHEGDITRENHTTGNIGVTTSQQMLEQEIEVAAKLNVSKLIVDSFKDRFCILVY